MGSHSPHPNSLSPPIKPTSTAFQWPIPDSPSRLKPIHNTMNELSIKEILEKYNDDPELMKYILTAKSEEDKKKAAKDTLKAEEARIQLRQMDLDFAREQAKASARYERHSLHPGHHFAPPPLHAIPTQHLPPQPTAAAAAAPPPPPTPQHQQQQQQQQQPPPPSQQQQHPQQQAQPSYAHYYGLAPVQQQVLARFNYPAHYSGQHPPPSPSVPYPHSAHPLCTSTTNTNTDRVQQLRQSSPPSSPTTSTEEPNNQKKRNRTSITSPNEQQQQQQQTNDSVQDKLSHNKVMEALKAKIKRGGNGGGPPSPLATTTPTIQEHQHKKRKATLPRPVMVHSNAISSSSPSPSPRSAKPVLPPIDTNLGRMDSLKLEVGNHSSGSSSSSSSSGSHGSMHSNSHKSTKEQNITKSTTTHTTTTNTTTTAVASPSDHILLNTRRARSLSPSASSLSTKKT